jgi:hypothetical protein
MIRFKKCDESVVDVTQGKNQRCFAMMAVEHPRLIARKWKMKKRGLVFGQGDWHPFG